MTLPLKLELPNVSGPEVLQVQDALGRKGFTVPRDATFGIRTEKAIKAFQQSVGLAATGQVDAATHELLFGSQIA